LRSAHGFRGGQGVGHIILCEPGAAGLDDSVANLVHVSGVVRVGVDHDLHVQFFCAAQAAIESEKSSVPSARMSTSIPAKIVMPSIFSAVLRRSVSKQS
jgi:hypothetical protein